MILCAAFTGPPGWSCLAKMKVNPQSAFPCPPLPDEMVPRARHKVEFGADTPAFMLQVRRLHTEVLRVLGMVGDPVQQPVVALITAGHLQGDHIMASESHQPKLGPFTGKCQGCAHPDKAKPSPKVWVVFQG